MSEEEEIDDSDKPEWAREPNEEEMQNEVFTQLQIIAAKDEGYARGVADAKKEVREDLKKRLAKY